MLARWNSFQHVQYSAVLVLCTCCSFRLVFVTIICFAVHKVSDVFPRATAYYFSLMLYVGLHKPSAAAVAAAAAAAVAVVVYARVFLVSIST